jgi:hypothetical protein
MFLLKVDDLLIVTKQFFIFLLPTSRHMDLTSNIYPILIYEKNQTKTDKKQQ